MPLARWAVYQGGPQIWLAPTADDSDGWQATIRHIAIESGASEHGGTFHGARGQVRVFGRQLRKRAVDARDEVRGRVRRDGTGRDHGYPGGRARPPRFDPTAADEANP